MSCDTKGLFQDLPRPRGGKTARPIRHIGLVIAVVMMMMMVVLVYIRTLIIGNCVKAIFESCVLLAHSLLF